MLPSILVAIYEPGLSQKTKCDVTISKYTQRSDLCFI